MRNDDPHVGPAKNSGLTEPLDAGPRPSPWLARLSDPDLALACMFALGSTQGVVVMSLPHWRTDSAAIVLGVALGGGLTAPLIWLLRGRLRGWSGNSVWASAPRPPRWRCSAAARNRQR